MRLGMYVTKAIRNAERKHGYYLMDGDTAGALRAMTGFVALYRWMAR